MFNKIYHADFSEAVQRRFDRMLNFSDELSWKDQKFFQLMEKEVTMEDSHYQLPLPFRKRDQHWPNNRVQAKTRLQGLKKRFMKDENFFKDDSNFMEDLFQKWYAERSPNASDGNKWYIPHYGVYHPAKPGKIRVVFDCSAEYLGYALNEQLIPGPDLTNQIIGVQQQEEGKNRFPLHGRHWGESLDSRFLNVNKACYNSCEGKTTTSTTNLLIIRYAFMYLEVHITKLSQLCIQKNCNWQWSPVWSRSCQDIDEEFLCNSC